MSIAINLVKGYRVGAGISQLEMAKELGMSEPTYRVLENNPDKFTVEQIKKFVSLIQKVEPEAKAEDIFFK